MKEKKIVTILETIKAVNHLTMDMRSPNKFYLQNNIPYFPLTYLIFNLKDKEII